MSKQYDRAIIGNGLTVRTRQRPEHFDRTLGANAPSYVVPKFVQTPIVIDPSVCAVPDGCAGKVAGELTGGGYRCSEHLAGAFRLGYAVVFCSWCDDTSLPPNGSHGCCKMHAEKIIADYRAGRAGAK
jgi:hypothetical protein